MTYRYSKAQPSDHIISNLSEYLNQIDAGCGYSDWFRVLAAIFYETKGSDAGFELADAWSSQGCNYRGTKDVRKQWRYLRLDLKKPITIGTLKKMAR